MYRRSLERIPFWRGMIILNENLNQRYFSFFNLYELCKASVKKALLKQSFFLVCKFALLQSLRHVFFECFISLGIGNSNLKLNSWHI